MKTFGEYGATVERAEGGRGWQVRLFDENGRGVGRWITTSQAKGWQAAAFASGRRMGLAGFAAQGDNNLLAQIARLKEDVAFWKDKLDSVDKARIDAEDEAESWGEECDKLQSRLDTFGEYEDNIGMDLADLEHEMCIIREIYLYGNKDEAVADMIKLIEA